MLETGIVPWPIRSRRASELGAQELVLPLRRLAQAGSVQRGNNGGGAPRLVNHHSVVEILVVEVIAVVGRGRCLPPSLRTGLGCLGEADGMILELVEGSERQVVQVIVGEVLPVGLGSHIAGLVVEHLMEHRWYESGLSSRERRDIQHLWLYIAGVDIIDSIFWCFISLSRRRRGGGGPVLPLLTALDTPPRDLHVTLQVGCVGAIMREKVENINR
jgi:hypothetical protein